MRPSTPTILCVCVWSEWVGEWSEVSGVSEVSE